MGGQHTPGPWKASQSHKGYWFIEYDQGGEAYTMTTLECHEANARLIAAAPDMLDALEWLLVSDEVESPEALSVIRDAVKRAKGEV